MLAENQAAGAAALTFPELRGRHSSIIRSDLEIAVFKASAQFLNAKV
jgi:hypothetical protein